jgi:hypothetical protein
MLYGQGSSSALMLSPTMSCPPADSSLAAVGIACSTGIQASGIP